VTVDLGFDAKVRALTANYSLEVTAKDVAALRDAAPLIAANTPLSITFLADEEPATRIAAVVAGRQLGFEPMPHFSARRIASKDDFEGYLRGVVEQAQVSRCFIVAGDPPAALGSYSDTLSLIQTGAFENAGIKAIGIGGHPEGHPIMSTEECWTVLKTKVQEIEQRGMSALIVTQFGFDSDRVLSWLQELRFRGLETSVRIGIPGPTNIRTLLRFAARCGVGASAAVMKKYGVSITNLLGSAGPDKLVDGFAQGLGREHGDVRLHFYPFGGLVKTVEWINNYRAHREA
jgi:methylenetetrahydrofolate reductase (NADPH)